MITSSELRQKYIDFFKSKGHTEIPSASLIPDNDPSSLFITAGMQPLIPYLMGEKHPAGTRLVDAQKCVRTGDIDDVGDYSHLTFFEMLGNWSLGDYFKDESLRWSFEFLIDKNIGLGLDPKRLYVTVFAGEDGIPRDERAIEIWQDIFASAGLENGVAENGELKPGIRIIPLGKKDNFWIAGETGPCGGDSEIFYDTSPELGEPIGDFDALNKNRIIEIWNNVFMEFEKKADGSLEKLPSQNVDTGMGLERTIITLNGFKNVYETDLFDPIIKKISDISGQEYTGDENDSVTRSMRVIADHTRSATMIMADNAGVEPSNVDQGYVVRKLIRRAIRHAKMIGIENNFLSEIAEVVIASLGGAYPELGQNRDKVLHLFESEENKFRKTIESGLKELNKIFSFRKENDIDTFEIKADDLFYLYTTHGFPVELTFEEIDKIRKDNNKLPLDENLKNHFLNLFNKKLKDHQDLSRTASAGKFKGGLGGHSDQAIKYHTATHLLLSALRQVLGEEVYQKGSNITDERMRFDFSYPDKLTSEQKEEVTKIVNDYIKADLPVVCEEMSLGEARARNAMGVFGDKYDNQVKVYTIGNDEDKISSEICGGPHVERTGELGTFRIKKEESSSAGVRRIKAVLE